eukprot:CAMPEP_0117026252 /NCGR_PEP_ID=MMETSP0472-20121206/19322_1 /TAXON_ID=693140 ORGANISM="Tiarina fusus, Strain LIS" /NCGR_SAMPLE_ID=MMETSP0472 /ASSEMBLY_ACC=CAM_ASM_000603 /LENGTH=120 /DNA_ID=CAMNT_0004733215 /DNA_START=123 /DNA_END=485 /DNA_ORIENTATION=+
MTPRPRDLSRRKGSKNLGGTTRKQLNKNDVKHNRPSFLVGASRAAAISPLVASYSLPLAAKRNGFKTPTTTTAAATLTQKEAALLIQIVSAGAVALSKIRRQNSTDPTTASNDFQFCKKL